MKSLAWCHRWKPSALILLALGLLALPLAAAEGVWTVSPAFASRYVFRGVKQAGASFQPWVDYTSGPLSVGVWSSVALQDEALDRTMSEMDLYGSYAFTVEPGALVLLPGFTVYTYPEASRGEGSYPTAFEPSLAAIFTVRGIQLTPKAYYDVMRKGATFELTAALALPLKSLGTELDFSATAGTYKWNAASADAARPQKNWGDYWSLGAAVPVQITARSKLTFGLSYADGVNNFFKRGTRPKEANPRARGGLAVTVGCAISL